MLAKSTADVALSTERRVDSRNQLVACRILEHVSQRTRRETTLDQDRLGMYGYQDDPSIRVVATDKHGGADPIEAWHGDVGNDYVGRKAGDRIDESAAVPNEGDYIEARLEQRAQLLGRFRMVVGQQHRRAAQGLFVTCHCASVPEPRSVAKAQNYGRGNRKTRRPRSVKLRSDRR